MHPSWIEINLRHFRKNIAIIKNAIGNARLCVPVKANAYGHGLIAIAKVLESERVDYLAVAHLSEALALRGAGISMPILVLGAIHDDQIDELLKRDLEVSVSSAYKANLLKKRSEALLKRCRIHLEIDTGMRRTGMRPDTAASLFSELKKSDCFEIVGVYSHMATANEPDNSVAKKQIEAFSSLLEEPPFLGHALLRHIASSGSTVHFANSHLDMVRPAMLCFGYKADNAPPSFAGISPCFSLKARVSFVKTVRKGEGISYGHTHVAAKDSRIVTVPVGYGDGYRRCLSNKGSVIINGRRYPIVGSICMDQFMVDVSGDSVFVGDQVTLVGKDGPEEITIKEIADICGTIPYEILCLFNDRIPRVYLD